jgi:hypothetical protein
MKTKGVFRPAKIKQYSQATKAKVRAFGEAIKGKAVFVASNKAAEEIVRNLKFVDKA